MSITGRYLTTTPSDSHGGYKGPNLHAALAQNKDVLELRRIEVEQTKAERWNGRLPSAIYAGAPIPFLNVK